MITLSTTAAGGASIRLVMAADVLAKVCYVSRLRQRLFTAYRVQIKESNTSKQDDAAFATLVSVFNLEDEDKKDDAEKGKNEKKVSSPMFGIADITGVVDLGLADTLTAQALDKVLVQLGNLAKSGKHGNSLFSLK
jgi:hypothetical protein